LRKSSCSFITILFGINKFGLGDSSVCFYPLKTLFLMSSHSHIYILLLTAHAVSWTQHAVRYTADQKERRMFSHLRCGNSGLVMTGCEVGGRDVRRSPAVEPHAHLPLPLGARNRTRRRVPWKEEDECEPTAACSVALWRQTAGVSDLGKSAERSPDCWTREAGLEMACSGPFRTLLAAAGMGPGGRPRDADTLGGAPPILSSLSSPAFLSRSPSSAVRLAPWGIMNKTQLWISWTTLPVKKFGVNQTISCFPWKLNTFIYQISCKMNRN